MIKKAIIILLLMSVSQVLAGAEKEWWQKWDNFPNICAGDFQAAHAPQ